MHCTKGRLSAQHQGHAARTEEAERVRAGDCGRAHAAAGTRCGHAQSEKIAETGGRKQSATDQSNLCFQCVCASLRPVSRITVYVISSQFIPV